MLNEYCVGKRKKYTHIYNIIVGVYKKLEMKSLAFLRISFKFLEKLPMVKRDPLL